MWPHVVGSDELEMVRLDGSALLLCELEELGMEFACMRESLGRRLSIHRATCSAKLLASRRVRTTDDLSELLR